MTYTLPDQPRTVASDELEYSPWWADVLGHGLPGFALAEVEAVLLENESGCCEEGAVTIVKMKDGSFAISKKVYATECCPGLDEERVAVGGKDLNALIRAALDREQRARLGIRWLGE